LTTKTSNLGVEALASDCRIASLNARQSDPMVVAYGAAKAAVVNLSKALAEEFSPKGIRVNSVSPGPVRTPLWVGPGGMAKSL